MLSFPIPSLFKNLQNTHPLFNMTKTLQAIFLNSLLSVSVLFVMACNARQGKQKKLTTADITASSAADEPAKDTVLNTKNLVLVRLSDNSYQHISFMNTNNFGRVNCNGMLVLNQGQAVIFDTPADKESSEELIRYVPGKLESKIIAIIPTHFHEDCVAGMEVFTKNNIQAFASNRTIQLLKNKGNRYADTMKGFDDSLTLNLGSKKVIAKYFGEGHTKDNVVGYFPGDNVMFGGCLIKELDASKGNLEDANTKEWSSTLGTLKRGFPDTKIVIPGHGKSGGTDLLDYTESLFKLNSSQGSVK